MKLIIFDMDQTLVDFIAVHDKVTSTLFRRFFNVDALLTEIDYSGRSLTDNFRELVRKKGIPEKDYLPRAGIIMENYDKTFASLVPSDGRANILPGVEKLLSALTAAGHLLMLYTGDSQGVVEAVFRSTGLGKYFRASFYGTIVKTRADMVGQAIKKGREMTGRDFKGRDVVIIGDSIRDIECAKQFNAVAIAVATGFHTAEELHEKKPDFLFKNLNDYQSVLKAIEGTL